MKQRGSLRALVGICEFHKSFFWRWYPNGSLPGTSTYFSGLFKTSSSPSATASKETMQNIVMATVEFYLCNTE